jgi:hypothetical protein
MVCTCGCGEPGNLCASNHSCSSTYMVHYQWLAIFTSSTYYSNRRKVASILIGLEQILFWEWKKCTVTFFSKKHLGSDFTHLFEVLNQASAGITTCFLVLPCCG